MRHAGPTVERHKTHPAMLPRVPGPATLKDSLKGVLAQRLQLLRLDYPVKLEPRYGWGRPTHPQLEALLAAGRPRYRALLEEFAANIDQLGAISTSSEAAPGQPSWSNDWIHGLDGVAIYSFLARMAPRLYLEVGSGTSTRFARRAIDDRALPTTIVSIDPHPRAEVDGLCDEVVRDGLEKREPHSLRPAPGRGCALRRRVAPGAHELRRSGRASRRRSAAGLRRARGHPRHLPPCGLSA